jgi:hypothetical protein
MELNRSYCGSFPKSQRIASLGLLALKQVGDSIGNESLGKGLERAALIGCVDS